MYPVSSVTSGATASSGATESVDGSNGEGGIVQGGGLQQVEFSSFPTSNIAVIATGERVSTRTVGEASAEVFGTSIHPGGLSAVGAVSTAVIPPGGTESSLPVMATTSTALTTTDREVDARSVGGVPAQKPGTTYTVVSSSAATAVSQRDNTANRAKKRAISAISSSQPEIELSSLLEPQPNLHLQSEAQSSSSSATIASTAAADRGKEVDAESDREWFSAQKPAAASPYCASICAMVLPECAPMIEDLFSEVGALARSIYGDVISKQLPAETSVKLSVTERAIWYRTYMKMCEANLVFKCLGEYHAKHRPGFVRSLSKIKLLSDSEVGLLGFLLELDCAIRREAEYIFSSCWSEVSVSLEEESLDAISCRDFVRVLDVAGVPEVALSANVGSYVKGGGSKVKGVVPVTGVVDLTDSSSPSSQLSPSQQCVDLLGVKLHPDSAKPIYDLFSAVRLSAKKSCFIILNCLLRAMSSELSVVGKAVWCRTYRELHLLNFMAKCLCLYHSRYRPDFIGFLADVRVLSSSHDRSLVPLSGDVLLDFLSKLDCSISDQSESVFNSEWDEEAKGVLVALEDGSLADVNCEDLVNVLDVAGIPKVASLISTKYERYQKFLINKSKTSGIDSKCKADGTKSAPKKSRIGSKRKASGTNSAPKDPEIDLNFYGIHFRKILPKPNPGASDQRDSVSATGNVSNVVESPVDTGSSLPIILLLPLPQSQPQPEFSLPLASVSVTDTVTAAAGGTGYSVPIVTESVAVSDQPSSVSVTDTVTAALPLHGVTGSSVPVVTESASASTVLGESSSIISGGVVASTGDIVNSALGILEDELSVEPSSSFSLAPLPLSSPPSDLIRVGDDISSFSSSSIGDAARSAEISVAPVFLSLEDESLASPPHSISILPVSSSSSSLSSSLPLSPSESVLDADVSSSSSPSSSPSSTSESPVSTRSGVDADVSSSSSESPLSTREVIELATEGNVSALGTLGELHSVTSCEQPIVPTTVSSSVSVPIKEFTTVTSSSYPRGPKKSFMIRSISESFEVPMGGGNAVAGPSSAPVDVSAPLMAVTGVAAEEHDVGARLAALLNQGLPPSPLPAGEPSGSMRGGRGRRGRGRRGRGRSSSLR
ncbi:hypothetical protein [Candidatus Ichthyocystis sparus]|uniref:hypothetical protein n=1 Tax=Candidatus Ichthyocystis sparus TaxID=1561004 RepID=UPI000B89EA5A|nr:hypothetical protein [Candidatus Ichthyocystis sparus]